MAVRLLVGFVSLLIYMKVLGKMQLAPTSAIDQIGNYVLGGIIGGIIYNLELPLWQFFAAIVLWGILMLGVNALKLRSLRAKRVIDGKPILLMHEGAFITDAFAQAGLSADSLVSQLHQQGITSMADLRTIWLEPNSQLTVVRQDDDDMAYTLIEDGQINEIDLTMAGKDEAWVIEALKKQGVDNIANVFCGELVGEKLNLYLYKPGQPHSL